MGVAGYLGRFLGGAGYLGGSKGEDYLGGGYLGVSGGVLEGTGYPRRVWVGQFPGGGVEI